MCNHLSPWIDSLMEIAICSNEDCVFKFHPQCLKCSFKFCQKHFKECFLGDRIKDILKQLLKENENMEKKIVQLQSNFNKKTTYIAQQCRQQINKISQLIENGLLQDIIPLNLDIDFIQEVLDQICKEIDIQFEIIMVYLEQLKSSFNIYNRNQSKIDQKLSILFEQEGLLAESLKSINSSLDMDPTQIFSIFQKGNILFKQHQYEESYNYLLKALLLSKKSKKVELKLQIFITFQEYCLFQMKKFSDIIEYSNKYEKLFDIKNFSMFKYFALFNKRKYEELLQSLQQINVGDEANSQQQYIFQQLSQKAEKSKSQILISKDSQIKIKDMLKNFQNQSQSQPNKAIQEDQLKDNKKIIQRFKKALIELENIIYENNDEKNAFLIANQKFILQLDKNQIQLINCPDENYVKQISNDNNNIANR